MSLYKQDQLYTCRCLFDKSNLNTLHLARDHQNHQQMQKSQYNHNVCNHSKNIK